MDDREGFARRQLRSVFVSDLHLGCRYSQAEPLLAFLNSIQPQYLYLVGDIIDGWRLARRWHWRPEFSRIVTRLLELGRAGTQVRFTPGNHDAFLREFTDDFGFVEIADSFVHEAADGGSSWCCTAIASTTSSCGPSGSRIWVRLPTTHSFGSMARSTPSAGCSAWIHVSFAAASSSA